MPKDHKKPLGKRQIRTSRKGKEHVNNCDSGYPATTGFYRNVHHIICISCVSDATISKQFEDDEIVQFIKSCLHVTKWNINAGENCISLPLKRAYVFKSAPSGWDGFPCHQVDHNPHYTSGISECLKTYVWEPCIEVGEECEFNPVSLKAELEECSNDFRNFLITRGRGTANNWKRRHEIPNSWYIPFSMHPDTPTKRKPPPDWDDFSESMKKYLKDLFFITKT